jgi:hypothetical protein
MKWLKSIGKHVGKSAVQFGIGAGTAAFAAFQSGTTDPQSLITVAVASGVTSVWSLYKAPPHKEESAKVDLTKLSIEEIEALRIQLGAARE